MKAKKMGTKKEKESSSVFFQNLRPQFLDWEPPTEEQKAAEVQARKEAREAELKRVTELAKVRDAEKGTSKGRYRSAGGKNKAAP